MPAPDVVIDPHIHQFDVRGTPRPAQPLARLLGWNERLLRAAAKRAFPKPMIDFFGEDNHLITDYLPPDFRAESRPKGVESYVHIQAGWKDKAPLDAVGETEWLDGLDDPPAGIVGYADLALGNGVLPVLQAHKRASSRFRGIRHMITNHPAEGVLDFAEDPDLGSSSAFLTGAEHLVAEGLTFDAWCYGHQLGQIATLASSHPELKIALCHGGTPVGFGGGFAGQGVRPSERDDIAAEWRAGIDAVAANPNVVVKLSGFLMPVVGFGFEKSPAKPKAEEIAERVGPLVRHCIDAFGPERCMFGSNFPVDKVSASYAELFDATVMITAEDGPAAQAAIFADTARKFYAL